MIAVTFSPLHTWNTHVWIVRPCGSGKTRARLHGSGAHSGFLPAGLASFLFPCCHCILELSWTTYSGLALAWEFSVKYCLDRFCHSCNLGIHGKILGWAWFGTICIRFHYVNRAFKSCGHWFGTGALVEGGHTLEFWRCTISWKVARVQLCNLGFSDVGGALCSWL